MTVEDLSNAPQPAINGIADVAFTGTDAVQDPPALKSVPLSALSKGVADEIDSEALLQNYTLKTAFIQDQTRQDETIALNLDKIEKLTTRVSAVEENNVTSTDLSNYLPLTGGCISNDSKSMSITPSGFNGDGGQSISDFFNVQADTLEGTVIRQNGENLNKYFFDYEYDDGNLPQLNNNTVLQEGSQNKKNYYYLKFNNGILMISMSIPVINNNAYIILPLSFCSKDYQVFLGCEGIHQLGYADYYSVLKSTKTNFSFQIVAMPKQDLPYLEGGDRTNILCIGRWK